MEAPINIGPEILRLADLLLLWTLGSFQT